MVSQTVHCIKARGKWELKSSLSSFAQKEHIFPSFIRALVG